MHEFSFALGVLTSIVCVITMQIVSPSHQTCLRGFYVNGVRPNGSYECRSIPPRDDQLDEWIKSAVEQSYKAQVYCTGGSHPIVVDYKTVGCQR
jgi:hypothetical protein